LRLAFPSIQARKLGSVTLQRARIFERIAISESTLAAEPLGHHEDRIWPPDPGGYGGRRARKGGRYRVFVPGAIGTRGFSFGDEPVSAIADASRALARLDGNAPRTASLNALATNLLRSESAASSRIEGIAVSHKRLARAAYRGSDDTAYDHRAAEVLGNVEAMKRAVELGSRGEPLSVDDILDIHRTLLRFTDDHGIAGAIRDKQNWIGGNAFNPLGAAFVPPPPELVPDLLSDLCAFIARDDVAPAAQAAIAHAQFENIHPFADGNGRTGRALIYAILRRRGEIANYIPPISLVLVREQREYIDGLGAYSRGDVDRWTTLLADAITGAAGIAEQLAAAIEQRQLTWLERLGNPRSDAAVRQIVAALPAQPVIDVAAGREITGKSHVAVGAALRQLEAADIVQPLNERRWGRVWECDELLELVGNFERNPPVQ
jgi:Fic family protein